MKVSGQITVGKWAGVRVLLLDHKEINTNRKMRAITENDVFACLVTKLSDDLYWQDPFPPLWGYFNTLSSGYVSRNMT